MDEVEKIARLLTKGAVRACKRMSEEWQYPGRETFSANGAWFVWLAIGKQLCDRRITLGRAQYRLTPLGLRVRDHLLNQKGQSDG